MIDCCFLVIVGLCMSLYFNFSTSQWLHVATSGDGIICRRLTISYKIVHLNLQLVHEHVSFHVRRLSCMLGASFTQSLELSNAMVFCRLDSVSFGHIQTILIHFRLPQTISEHVKTVCKMQYNTTRHCQHSQNLIVFFGCRVSLH